MIATKKEEISWRDVYIFRYMFRYISITIKEVQKVLRCIYYSEEISYHVKSIDNAINTSRSRGCTDRKLSTATLINYISKRYYYTCVCVCV